MSKIDEIIHAIEQMIDRGALAPNARLPSIRRAAEQFGAAKNTVVEAYGRLAAQQIIHSRQGAGYFVNDRNPTIARHAGLVSEASDAVSLLRAQLAQDYVIRPGDGRPPLSWMKEALPKRIDTNLLVSAESDQTGYGNPRGNANLRELLVRRFVSQNIPVSLPQIVTTFGANHALDLLIRRYLSPGQSVLVDDPGYYPLFAKLRLAQVEAIPVPRRENGPDLQKLEDLTRQHAPQFFFTQSTAQNPTGTSYDLQTAHKTLQITSKYGCRVVDDDPFFDLPSSGETGCRLCELDGFQSVIYIGSYSKLLSASFRSGFIVADSKTVDELSEFKMITTVNSSRLSEMMIANMVSTNRYDKHLQRLERQLANARDDCISAFRRLGLKMYTDAPKGFYTMLTFPSGTDIDHLREMAHKHRVFLALGQWFSPQTTAETTTMRVNFSRAADQRFYTFLERSLVQ